MIEGSASTVIDRPVGEVFAAVTDATRMGEWSPECVGGRWIEPSVGAAAGARFEGDNVAKMGPVTLKKWTTTCEITEFVPNEVFEFVAADFTTWRYEFEDHDGATSVTESFSHEPYTGRAKFMYETISKRSTGLITAMEGTLARIKKVLEDGG